MSGVAVTWTLVFWLVAAFIGCVANPTPHPESPTLTPPATRDTSGQTTAGDPGYTPIEADAVGAPGEDRASCEAEGGLWSDRDGCLGPASLADTSAAEDAGFDIGADGADSADSEDAGPDILVDATMDGGDSGDGSDGEM